MWDWICKFFIKENNPTELAIKQVMKNNKCSWDEACKRKVEIIKQVRENTGLGLKEAKGVVDSYF